MNAYCPTCGSHDTSTGGGIVHHFQCQRANALQAPLADHGISPAQLHEKVEALELSIGTAHNEAASDRAIVLSLEKRLDAALKRIEQQDKTIALLLDRVNQLVEFHGIRPIGEES